MPSDSSFDDINDLSQLKYQIWTSENENGENLLDSEPSNKLKVKAKGLNRKQEHNIVNQVN